MRDNSGENYLSKEKLVALSDDNAIAEKVANDTKKLNYDSISISKLVFDGYNLSFSVVALKDGNGVGIPITFSSTYGRNNMSEYEALADAAGIDYSYTDPNAGSIWTSLLPLGGTLLIAVVFFILIMQTQGGTKGAMNFAKTNARINHNIKVRFSDVAGAEEEKAELAEVVDFLKNPAKFSTLGARIPKGVLLVGPPGTGKTLFAKAVAGEAGVPFFSISGSDFVEMFVGVGASRVRDLFDVAKKNMSCIMFIDEIDAVGRQRGTGMGGGHDEREQTLNQLLVQMDGFETNDGIIVMAATNRADILDPALLRPGRFDRQIYVNVPDVRGREAILKVHARNKPLSPDVNFKTVARMTSGFSGADLENLLNEAAILAARANRKYITNKDLYEGINKVLLGPQKKSRLVTETDKRITAYHESGHAVLARLLPHCDPVHEVSIIPRGQAAGYTMTRPDSDDNHLTKAKLLDDIVMTLGGRVAEELIIKDISAGASGDIQAVSKRARYMVTEWGMSDKVGPISYASDKEIFIGRDMASHVTYSEETAAIIDEEVQRIIMDALEKARKLLKENKSLLDTMARVLVERETIFSEEVDMIMEGKSAEEIMDFMDANEHTLSENPFARKAGPDAVKHYESKTVKTEDGDRKDGSEEEKTVKKRASGRKPKSEKPEKDNAADGSGDPETDKGDEKKDK
ncbi:MAG: ATP-dependent zinc metalloprotease FtsH [Clostridia bacterium]|nr:ATP-dependent zinc metalloprotease FtsH [Clostridia bacterium]